jgi:hypothetical protein
MPGLRRGKCFAEKKYMRLLIFRFRDFVICFTSRTKRNLKIPTSTISNFFYSSIFFITTNSSGCLGIPNAGSVGKGFVSPVFV